MKKQLQTDIYSLAFGGKGVGKVDGKICFVSGALPDEKVIFTVEKDTPRYIEGTVTEILTFSPDRVEPVCRYYGRCGGCQTQHLDYQKELFYKKEQIVELIKRISGIKSFECADIVASSKDYYYRNSITVHKKDRGYGYYERDSRTIVEIEECSLADEEINKELQKVTGKKNDITLKIDFEGKVWSTDRVGERFFIDQYRDVNLYMSPKAFSQPNRYIAQRIAETLENYIGPEGGNSAFFDVYCGVGFFSFLLKQDFGLRVGIDSSRVAIDCAKSTAKKLGLRDRVFYKGEVEKDFFRFFEKNKRSRNILFIDPSRSGAEKNFLKKIREHEDIDKLFYLSCDPARLARDIKILTDNSSWTLGRVSPFDMFPKTKHIETLVEFLKN